ncbi:YlmH family RNA-binding protein [Peptostreptococcus faecalis]|uniref:YlmH family RNA-binding protein n=1 Tax=Peptostreptococcus faecalis TaxID=2045015 RepID=UPI000C7BC4A0|nr:YlmH/Sll1252 family protein [Peptostreptococcus faecalis]
MDKIKLTNHITDEDLRLKMYRVVDICNSVLKNHEVKKTEFLNPYEIKNAVAIVNTQSELSYIIDGGYVDAERAVLIIYPYYLQEEEIVGEDLLRFIQINGNFKFSSVSHRDYLGSILGLGIKREKIGDIIVHENYCQFILDSEVSDYVLYNCERVGRNKVTVEYIHRNEIVNIEQEFVEKKVTVSSLRIDAIISSVFNLSRQESLKLCEGERVYMDYEKIAQPSKLVQEKALISVRTKGKFILSEIGNTTKKGKIMVIINKYV